MLVENQSRLFNIAALQSRANQPCSLSSPHLKFARGGGGRTVTMAGT